MSCTGTTSVGKRCTKAPLAETQRWAVQELHLVFLPSAAERCTLHLPPNERAALNLAIENREQRRENSLNGISPVCWSWPLPRPRELAPDHDVESAGMETLQLWHADRCAVCGQDAEHFGQVRDHDHVTGLIRGLLCYRCNGLEGRWWGGTDTVFDRYRARPPAAILGLSLPYRHAHTGEIVPPEPPITDRWGAGNPLRGLGL